MRMNGNRPKIRQSVRLARGIPLACLLALSACSSGLPRETPLVPVKDVGVTTEAAKFPTRAPDAVSHDVEDIRKPISTVRSEEKNSVAGRSIYFPDGDAALSEESIKILGKHAEYLKQNPKQMIVLRAYLDRTGSRTFSLAIVQNRLNAVAQTLHEHGVAKSRIRQVLLGQRGKMPSCESPSCKNRGQHIELIYK